MTYALGTRLLVVLWLELYLGSMLLLCSRTIADHVGTLKLLLYARQINLPLDLRRLLVVLRGKPLPFVGYRKMLHFIRRKQLTAFV